MYIVVAELVGTSTMLSLVTAVADLKWVHGGGRPVLPQNMGGTRIFELGGSEVARQRA